VVRLLDQKRELARIVILDGAPEHPLEIPIHAERLGRVHFHEREEEKHLGRGRNFRIERGVLSLEKIAIDLPHPGEGLLVPLHAGLPALELPLLEIQGAVAVCQEFLICGEALATRLGGEWPEDVEHDSVPSLRWLNRTCGASNLRRRCCARPAKHSPFRPY
jgi:hypothetical protein